MTETPVVKEPMPEEKRLRTLSNANLVGELRKHQKSTNHLRFITASVLLVAMGAPLKRGNDPCCLVHNKPAKKTRIRKRA